MTRFRRLGPTGAVSDPVGSCGGLPFHVVAGSDHHACQRREVTDGRPRPSLTGTIETRLIS